MQCYGYGYGKYTQEEETMTSKPAALQLAATLDALGWRSVDKDMKTAAAELRRLHARVVELESAALRTPVPPGWQLVPLQPTSEMLNVAGQTEEIHNEYGEELYVKNTGAVYQVMLAAAPRTPEPTTPDSSSIVSDEDIVRAFEGTNFGTDNHRELLHVGVLKKACQYHCGHTITTIMRDLGLIRTTGALTKKGVEMLRVAYHKQMIGGA